MNTILNKKHFLILIVAGGDIPSRERLEPVLERNPFIIAVNGGFRNCRKVEVIPHLLIGDLDSLNHREMEEIRGLTRETDETQNRGEGSNKISVLKYPKEKDESDLELALKWAWQKAQEYKIPEIIMTGVLGGRIDHELFNLFLLLKYKDWDEKGGGDEKSCGEGDGREGSCDEGDGGEGNCGEGDGGEGGCHSEFPPGRGPDAGEKPRIKILTRTSRLFLLKRNEIIEEKQGTVISLIPLSPRVEGVTLRGFYYGLEDEILFMGSSRGLSNILTQSPALITHTQGSLLAVINDLI